MTPSIHHLSDTLIGVVGLPEKARDFSIFNDVGRPYLSYYDYSPPMSAHRMYLDDGNWTILGWSTELDEATCAGLVESDTLLGGGVTIYKNYSEGGWLPTPEMSFASLLRSHGIEGRVLILRKD